MSDAPRPPLFYRFVRMIVRNWVWWMGGVTIIGSEHIPAHGPVILAPNHRAHVDPPYLSLITPRPMHFMAKEELFKVPVLNAIIRGVGTFPVKRGVPDRAALRHAIDLLKAGGIVTIFPEGTRSEDGALRAAEKGFALIARQANAAIVPIAIEGTEEMLPKGAKRLRRAAVRITVGVPTTVGEILAGKPEGAKDALGFIGQATMSAIAELMRHPGDAGENIPGTLLTGQ